MKFDYYIFLDYSKDLVGYIIIKENQINELLKKTSRFKHYKESKKRKIYLKHINKTVKKEKILSHIFRSKIKETKDNLEIYTDILDFIHKQNTSNIFLSIDDYQFKKFKKLVHLIDGEKIKIIKEGNLEKNSKEFKMNLIIDNILNIKRRQQK